MYYLNTFFVYSILGFLFETAMSFITKSHFKSGILYGPWTPVYGMGIIITILLSNYLFKSLHLQKIVEILIVFLVITAVLTISEWLAGISIEFIFKKIFWDYSNYKFHIGHYIALNMSLLWGFGSIIILYVIKPMLEKTVKNIPIPLTIILSILFIIDALVTIVTKAKG